MDQLAKLNRTTQFDPTKFNDEFEKNDSKRQDMPPPEIQWPHKKTFDIIVISLRNIFYFIIESLLNLQNPLPRIFSRIDLLFSFSLFMLLIGFILLFITNSLA
jgi:hypothetical protein